MRDLLDEVLSPVLPDQGHARVGEGLDVVGADVLDGDEDLDLGRLAPPEFQILVEVNVSGEPGKSGVVPGELDAFIARAPVSVAGLMTMPPLAARAQDNRPHFAALAGLARDRGLRVLSMGTSQDFEVAVEEGATIVRIGTTIVA